MNILEHLQRLKENDVLPSFDCGDEDLNNYFFCDAKPYQEQLLAVTYYAANENETLFFFSLSNDKVTSLESDKGFWRKLKSFFPHSKHRKDYPAVKIGRFGVNRKYQHCGLHVGTDVLGSIKRWMVSGNKTGCRFITVDAYHAAVPFYLQNGFLFMGNAEKLRYETRTGDTVAMFFDLMTII